MISLSVTYRMRLLTKQPTNLVEYYQNNFGMKLIRKLDFEESKFSLYFLAFDSPGAESAGRQWTDREGILELTHNCRCPFLLFFFFFFF